MNTKVKTKENKAQNENYTQNQAKKGISLIVLVITIIVIVILAVAVILTLANNNPIENANKASFQNDLKAVCKKNSSKRNKQNIGLYRRRIRICKSNGRKSKTILADWRNNKRF